MRQYAKRLDATLLTGTPEHNLSTQCLLQAQTDLAVALEDIEATLLELKRERLLAEYGNGGDGGGGAADAAKHTQQSFSAAGGQHQEADGPRGGAAPGWDPAAASAATSAVRIGEQSVVSMSKAAARGLTSQPNRALSPGCSATV